MTLAETKSGRTGEKTTQALAATGFAASLFASSCCVLPLLLLAAGIGGAGMAWLTGLAPYQPLFLAAAAIGLGWGFWRSYRQGDCGSGGSCEKPGGPRITRILLWLGAAAMLAALSPSLILPLLV